MKLANEGRLPCARAIEWNIDKAVYVRGLLDIGVYQDDNPASPKLSKEKPQLEYDILSTAGLSGFVSAYLAKVIGGEKYNCIRRRLCVVLKLLQERATFVSLLVKHYCLAGGGALYDAHSLMEDDFGVSMNDKDGGTTRCGIVGSQSDGVCIVVCLPAYCLLLLAPQKFALDGACRNRHQQAKAVDDFLTL